MTLIMRLLYKGKSLNKMLSISVFDLTNLEGERKAILKAAEKGVTAATHEGAEWIKDDVIQGEEYVGTRFYPDVKASTKRAKARKGQDTVLIGTTNTLSSFDGEVNGLEGKITGGGKDYHSRLFSRWRIGDLYMAVHEKESQEIIKKSIEKAI
jgi:hypothetical protein